MDKMEKLFNAFDNRVQRNKKDNDNFIEQSRDSSLDPRQNLLEWEFERGPKDPVFLNLKWILTYDKYKCDRVVSYLLSKIESKQYVGLDIEFDPCFQKGQTSRTALIQIGVHTGHCLLFHVHKVTKLPPLLVKLLIDPSILKLGVGIQDDTKKIRKDFDVQVQGAIDLRSIAPPAEKCGLASLVYDHLNTTLPKSKKLVMSKWSKELSPPKQAYAAKDAYVAVLLAQKLVAKEMTILEDKVERNDILTVQKTLAERIQSSRAEISQVDVHRGFLRRNFKTSSASSSGSVKRCRK